MFTAYKFIYRFSYSGVQEKKSGNAKSGKRHKVLLRLCMVFLTVTEPGRPQPSYRLFIRKCSLNYVLTWYQHKIFYSLAFGFLSNEKDSFQRVFQN